MSCTEVSTSRTERREKESVVESKVGRKKIVKNKNDR
jgi:hypothetical protein